MDHNVWSEVRGNALWDGFKEAAKLMLPFLAGLGIRQWVSDHVTALMWTGAFFVAGFIAFWDQLPKNRRVRKGAAPLGVKIHSAVYGTGPMDDVDVTERVRQQGTPGFVISVNNNTLGCDPAPGRNKRLEVHYSYLNGAVWKTSRPEYGRLILPEFKQADADTQGAQASKLRILSAKYGNPKDGYHDRRERVEGAISGDSLNLLIGREALGDPLEGKWKHLIVEYSYDGGPPLKAVRLESRRLLLPEDPSLLEQINGLSATIVTPRLRPVSVTVREGGQEYPLKVWCSVVNESGGVLDVRPKEFLPGAVTLKKFVTDVLTIKLRLDFYPKDHGVERLAILPGQQFQAWVGIDERTFTRKQVDNLKGQLGNLVFVANEQEIPIQL